MIKSSLLFALTLATLGSTTGTALEVGLPTARAESPDSEEKQKFEAVEFKARDKQTIHANFYPPRKKNTRAPGALLIHDAGSDARVLNGIAENLQRRGFAVLVPDLRGHGASITPACNWSKCADDKARTLNWGFAMRDLEAATKYLRKQDSVHNSNLSVVGVGAGATLVVRYALRDENARAVALIAPEPAAYGFDIRKDINELGGLPVMILAVDECRKQATGIQEASTAANDGIQFVEFKLLRPKEENDVFSDRRLKAELSKFLESQAMPQRR